MASLPPHCVCLFCSLVYAVCTSTLASTPPSLPPSRLPCYLPVALTGSSDRVSVDGLFPPDHGSSL